jgi:uncharacterized protein
MKQCQWVTDQHTAIESEQVHIGVPVYARQGVEMVTRKLRIDDGNKGIILYGYKFRPVGLGAQPGG